MASNSIITSSSSEQKWVDQINKVFQKEMCINIDGGDDDAAAAAYVSVFQVPKNMTIFKPDAFTPQVIALGPYHHLRPELYHMESHKLDAAKQVLNESQAFNFQHLVIDELIKFGPTIRACYHNYFDLTDETLAWIVAIDGIFLIHFLKNYGNGQMGDEEEEMIKNGMVRDIMMLENQIPIILLKKIWRILQLSSSNDNVDFELVQMLTCFCEAQSPLILSQDPLFHLNGKGAHLLDIMYQLIVYNRIRPTHSFEYLRSHLTGQELDSALKGKELDKDLRSRELELDLVDTVGEILERAVDIKIPGASEIQKPFKFIQSLPWDKIYGLLGKKINKEKLRIDNQEDQTPIIKEIDIPPASQLHEIAKIEFLPNSGGIRDINFNEDGLIFALPTITLNPNSEVILRNLLAYEALSAKGPKPRPASTLELSQYVDLMSGIIDKSEDSKLLREAGVIEGNTGDEEIANLFNKINKSSGEVEDEKSKLERRFDQVNEYFENRPRVRVYKALKMYGYVFLKFLTGFCTVLLLLLLILQTFCQFYDCNRLFRMLGPRDLGLKLYQPM